jgi:hypothetical protein
MISVEAFLALAAPPQSLDGSEARRAKQSQKAE